MYSCRDINVSFEHFSLENVGFSLPKGSILGIIGRNGTGKSTLIGSLLGVKKLLKEADACIDSISAKRDSKLYQSRIAYVPSDSIFPNIMQVLEAGQVYGRYYKDFDLEKYKKLLTEYKLPLNKSMASLSKGQKIRQMIAFALSYPSEVIFFDEPTGNLDVEFREELYKSIRKLTESEGKTIIYATHMIEELEEIADYILWLKKSGETSRVKYFGTIDELRDSYRMADERIASMVPIENIVGKRVRESNFEALVKLDDRISSDVIGDMRYAELKEIMYYEEKGEV